MAIAVLAWGAFAGTLPVGSTASADGGPPPLAKPATLTLTKPETVGLDSAKLAEIPVRLRGFVEAGEMAGAVTLVARRGQVVSLESVGHADLTAKRPMRSDTLFWVASMTKPVIAAALMLLVDEGRVDLDDPVAKYLPAFGAAKLADGQPPMTVMKVRHLLSHTSGIGRVRPDPEAPRPASLAKVVEEIAAAPLSFEPDSRWSYGEGLAVVGRIIEVVSDEGLESFLTRRLLAPLGMTDTGFTPNDVQRSRLAVIYKPGPMAGGAKLTATGASFINLAVSDRGRPPNPSGGLFSSAADMAAFYGMLAGGGEFQGRRVLSAQAVRAMTTSQTDHLAATKPGFMPGSAWGLGVCLVVDPAAHPTTAMLSAGSFGHGGAFGTQVWIDPVRELVMILLVQRTGFGNSDASELRREFQRLVVEAVRP